MPESPKFLLSINRKVETLKILEEMYSMNTHFDKKVYLSISHSSFIQKKLQFFSSNIDIL